MEMKRGKLLASACIHHLGIQGLIVGIREGTILGAPSPFLVVWGNFGARQGVAIVGLGYQEMVFAEACGPGPMKNADRPPLVCSDRPDPFIPLIPRHRLLEGTHPPAIPRRRKR